MKHAARAKPRHKTDSFNRREIDRRSWHVHGIVCVKIRYRTAITSSRDFTRELLLKRRPSQYQSVCLHCGVERSLYARFCGDWPGSFGVIDVKDRKTDKSDFYRYREDTCG